MASAQDLTSLIGPVSFTTNRFALIQTPPGSLWDLSRLYTTGEVTLVGNSGTVGARAGGVLSVS